MARKAIKKPGTGSVQLPVRVRQFAAAKHCLSFVNRGNFAHSAVHKGRHCVPLQRALNAFWQR